MPSFCPLSFVISVLNWINADHYNPKNNWLTNNTQPKSLGPEPDIGKISKSSLEREEGVWIMK